MSIDYDSMFGFGILVDPEELHELILREKPADYPNHDKFFIDDFWEDHEYFICMLNCYCDDDYFIGIPLPNKMSWHEFERSFGTEFLKEWNNVFPHTQFETTYLGDGNSKHELAFRSMLTIW